MLRIIAWKLRRRLFATAIVWMDKGQSANTADGTLSCWEHETAYRGGVEESGSRNKDVIVAFIWEGRGALGNVELLLETSNSSVSV